MNILSRTRPASLSQLSIELAVIFILSALYFYIIMLICRYSIMAEILICLLLPPAIYAYKRSGSSTSPRVIQLIIIESTFMLFVILSKTCLIWGNNELNNIIGYGFRSLFVIQFSFFMLYQYKVRSYLGLLRTLMFLALVIPWLNAAPLSGAIDAHGRFFFSGVQAPPYIILYYCTWVIGVPLVDSKTLPNFITATMHFSSVFIALLSQEFFHVRLLTASHLFILDYLLSYSNPNKKIIGIMSTDHFKRYLIHIQPLIDHLTLVMCIIIFIYGMFYVKH